jgi:hypothetical protein
VKLLSCIVLSKAVVVCAVAALKLKSILGVDPKIKDSIKDPFREETWLGGVRVRLRVQGTTTASGLCECYYLVSSLVF